MESISRTHTGKEKDLLVLLDQLQKQSANDPGLQMIKTTLAQLNETPIKMSCTLRERL